MLFLKFIGIMNFCLMLLTNELQSVFMELSFTFFQTNLERRSGLERLKKKKKRFAVIFLRCLG